MENTVKLRELLRAIFHVSGMNTLAYDDLDNIRFWVIESTLDYLICTKEELIKLEEFEFTLTNTCIHITSHLKFDNYVDYVENTKVNIYIQVVSRYLKEFPIKYTILDRRIFDLTDLIFKKYRDIFNNDDHVELEIIIVKVGVITFFINLPNRGQVRLLLEKDHLYTGITIREKGIKLYENSVLFTKDLDKCASSVIRELINIDLS